MTKTRWILVAAMTVAVVAGVVALAVAFPLEKKGQARIEAEANLPLTLTPEKYGDPVGTGTMVLESDGVARLTGFPVGDVDAAQGCISWDGAKTFTGTAKWSADRNLIITITTDDGDVAIGPYNPALSDIVWYRFGMSLCGDDRVVWYGATPAQP